MNRGARIALWRLALALGPLIAANACLAQGVKTQDISFGSLASIGVPASWVRSQERAVLPASLLKFAPSANSRDGLFVFDAGLSMGASAKTVQGVYGANISSPVALTPDQIEDLSIDLGNVGDNQYSNKLKWPDPGAPLFQISTVQAVSVKGKVAVMLDGSFIDPASGKPRLSFAGLFTPSDVGGRRMLSIYTQSPDPGEFVMLRNVFDRAVESIAWRGVPRPSAGPSNAAPAAPALATNNYADELTDWGVQPQPNLKSDVGTKTPMEIPGARRITTQEVKQLRNEAILLDVLDDKHAATIPDAIHVPGAGNFGRFDDQVQGRLFRLLSDLTNRDMNRPIVFFCEGPKCWESYNAALRAVNLGFRNVLWYRGGLASWTEANLPLVSIPPARRLR